MIRTVIPKVSVGIRYDRLSTLGQVAERDVDGGRVRTISVILFIVSRPGPARNRSAGATVALSFGA